MISLLGSSCKVGTATSTVTIWSPRWPGRCAFSTPRPLIRSFCPLCVPGGIFNCARPSMVGTSTLTAPSEASGDSHRERSTGCRPAPVAKTGCVPVLTMTKRSPAGPPFNPAVGPCPASGCAGHPRVPVLHAEVDRLAAAGTTPSPWQVTQSLESMPSAVAARTGNVELHAPRPSASPGRCRYTSGHWMDPTDCAWPWQVGQVSWRFTWRRA